jgi:multisubunit Na+/H+ antiporter MnhB subunit
MKQKLMNQDNHHSTRFQFLLIAVLIFMTAGLTYVLLTLPELSPGLSIQVTQNLQLSGVENPVTAVLLNFRAYDTLLEMSVLLLSLLAVWSLGNIPKLRETTPGAVLDSLSRLLIPLLILVAGYLLWIGASAPGGAFQAGAVLAAAGVLPLLSGWQIRQKFIGLPLRFALVTGLGIFITVGIFLILFGQQFLEFPPSVAAALILLIEAAATVSIGFTLVALFSGGRPESEPQ